jgi:hypothetical protein
MEMAAISAVLKDPCPEVAGPAAWPGGVEVGVAWAKLELDEVKLEVVECSPLIELVGIVAVPDVIEDKAEVGNEVDVGVKPGNREDAIDMRTSGDELRIPAHIAAILSLRLFYKVT